MSDFPISDGAVEAAAKVLKEIGDERVGKRPDHMVEFYLAESRAGRAGEWRIQGNTKTRKRRIR